MHIHWQQQAKIDDSKGFPNIYIREIHSYLKPQKMVSTNLSELSWVSVFGGRRATVSWYVVFSLLYNDFAV
jgi:hypothetical protein